MAGRAKILRGSYVEPLAGVCRCCSRMCWKVLCTIFSPESLFWCLFIEMLILRSGSGWRLHAILSSLLEAHFNNLSPSVMDGVPQLLQGYTENYSIQAFPSPPLSPHAIFEYPLSRLRFFPLTIFTRLFWPALLTPTVQQNLCLDKLICIFMTGQ